MRILFVLLLLPILAFAQPDFESTKNLAEQGDAEAQYNLGVMYATGAGVPKHDFYAYVWFSVAAAQGNENAREGRNRLKSSFSKEQQSNGQMLATECFNSNFKDCPF